MVRKNDEYDPYDGICQAAFAGSLTAKYPDVSPFFNPVQLYFNPLETHV